MQIRVSTGEHSHLQELMQVIGIGHSTGGQIRDLTSEARPLRDNSPESRLLEILYNFSINLPPEYPTTSPQDFAQSAFLWMMQNPRIDMEKIYSSISDEAANPQAIDHIAGLLVQFYRRKLRRKFKKAIPEFISEDRVPEELISFMSIIHPYKLIRDPRIIPNATLNGQKIDRDDIELKERSIDDRVEGNPARSPFFDTVCYMPEGLTPLEYDRAVKLSNKLERQDSREGKEIEKGLLHRKIVLYLKEMRKARRGMPDYAPQPRKEAQTKTAEDYRERQTVVRRAHNRYVQANFPVDAALKTAETNLRHVRGTRYAAASSHAGTEHFLSRPKIIIPIYRK